MWYEIKDDYVLFNVKAVPNSSKNLIVGLLDNSLKIKIKAPAVENAANKELIKFFSKRFKISKSDINFIGGMNSKRKKIKLPLTDKIKEFLEQITKENEK